MKKIFTLCALLLLLINVQAQHADSTSLRRKMPAPSSFHINQLVCVGGGFSSLSTGIVTNLGQTTKVSPGGGAGIGFQFGYRIPVNKLDFSLSAIFQFSPMTPTITNGSGSFSRTILEPMAKYIFNLNRSNHINAGLGLDYIGNGKLDIDASRLQGGGHNIYKFKGTTGLVVAAEYQWLRRKFGFGGGLKYYSITYHLDSMTSDGMAIPLSVLPQSVLNDVNVVDGGGIDFCLEVGYYF